MPWMEWRWFVGFRSRGMEHIKELQKIKGVRIVALCDVDSTVLAKGLKAVPGAKGYADIRKMLEDKDIDAVSIASPSSPPSRTSTPASTAR